MDSGNKSVGGRVVFIFYSLCQSLWVSSATINSIPKSTDSQDASSEARESVASHFSSTVTDEIGFLDDHEKYQENADSSDDAADEEEVNSNPVSNPGREKVKTFHKNRRSQKLSTCMGAESQMLQFAKEDLNLKRKLLEQLEKSDTDFNQNIAKVGCTMDTISNVMQQYVGILGNLA